MFCPRCRKKMQEEKRSFHKQRKWSCPGCGKVKFQRPKTQKVQAKDASANQLGGKAH